MSDASNWLTHNSGSSNPSVSFPNIGDTVCGRILEEPRLVNGTDLNGNPSESLVISVEAIAGCTASVGSKQIGYSPIAAGENVSIWVKAGAMARALQAAIVEAKAAGLQEGGMLAVRYSADGEQKKAGFNRPKLYVAQYSPPVPTVGLGSLIPTGGVSASSLI